MFSSGSASQTSNSFQSLDISVKYNGLIKNSFYKQARLQMFQLFDYIFSQCPPMYGVHNFMSWWRMLQFFGNALCAPNIRFWGNGHMYVALAIISVFFHFIPTMYRKDYMRYVCLAIVVLFLIAIGFLSICTVIFAKTAKLPKWCTLTISIFFATIGYVCPIAVIEYTGEMIGYLIMDESDQFVLDICIIVLAFIVTAFYIWLYSNIYSVTLVYRPDSLQVTIPSVASYLVIVTIAVTFIHGIAAHIPQLPQSIMYFVGAVTYWGSIAILFTKGGMVSEEKTIFLASSALSAGTGYAFTGVSCMIGQNGSEITIVVYCAITFIVYFIFHAIYTRIAASALATLDIFSDEGEADIRSPTKFADVAIHGLRCAHPAILNNSVFKWAIEKWPQSVDTWLLFAKFVAIYPEETQQLSWILMGMQQNHLKGSLAKHTESQIMMIMRQRESNLVPALKRQLDKVQKQIQATKHKVRYIWDLILQGNIIELEAILIRAYDSIDSTEAEILHLIRMYPNNRIIARTYARFLRDVVADHAGHKEWAHNVTLLQHGAQASPDQAHVLGLRAFPLLPMRKENVGIQLNNAVGMVTDDTLTIEIQDDDEASAADAELRMSVRESINNLKIPSYSCAILIRTLCLLLLFMVPVIAMAILMPIIIEEEAQPLSFMYALATLRTRSFQLIAVGLHYIFETMGLVNEHHGDNPNNPPVSWGNTYVSAEQIQYMAQDVCNTSAQLSPMMSYKSSSAMMDQVRDYIYVKALNFSYFIDDDPDVQPHVEELSIQNAAMEYVTIFRELLDLDKSVIQNGDIFKMKYVMIPTNNLESMDAAFTICLEAIRDFIISNNNTIEIVIYILMGVLLGLIPICYIGFAVYIAKRITREKMMIYRCLSTLPKNVVSRVADTFKVLKKDDVDDDISKTGRMTNEELNKQEENMLKIFSTSADSRGAHASDTVWIAVCSFFVVALFAGTAIMLCMQLIDCGTELVNNAPHLDYLMRSYAYDLCCLILIHMVGADFKGYSVRGFDRADMLELVTTWQDRSVDAYNAVRFGSKEMNAKPFTALSTSTTAASNCDPLKPPATEHDIYRCWAADMLISYMRVQLNDLLQGYIQNNTDTFELNDTILEQAWHISLIHIYDSYFYPQFNTLVEKVTDILLQDVPLYRTLSFVFLIIAIIVELMLLKELLTSEARQKFALRLLLHCPGSVVVSNPNITSILSGNFELKNSDMTTRNSQFYDVVVQDLPDAIFVLDRQGVITTTNRAAVRMFNLEETQTVGAHISAVIGEMFEGKENPFEAIGTTDSPEEFEMQLNFMIGDDLVHTTTRMSVLKDNLFITSRDITQTMNYDKLISDERAKSDQLLSSILPARLVPRVQAGEKNISFAVQSASVLFLDIVSFTPWCGSNSAQFVMSTLNRFFRELDQRLNMHPTLTKIKCIGDCYMAAGGIFSEVNQPAQHTKEMVEFGLEALDVVRMLDEELGLSLQIRVGINTGGPLVAGVLGTDKPTFEILGPTINMAQQMEHHGVPMKVHVSRAVYELIYGGNFDVKERGEIQIKNGTAVTYIVDRKPN